MQLFECEPQYREKAAIWRMFSLLPLYAALAAGRPWRWFAINIPMDLGTGGGEFTSDIDIIARLHDMPRSKGWIYKTWEVKVSLLCKDGTARSLKIGKTRDTLKQLNAYRKFGSPSVSLLDIYLCETGCLSRNGFPPPSLHESLSTKFPPLRSNRFGYQLLPFEHGKNADGDDFGVFVLPPAWNRMQATYNLLSAVEENPRQPFSRFVNHLDDFFESVGERRSKHFNQIVFCRECRQLQLLRMKEEDVCPACQSDLIAQV